MNRVIGQRVVVACSGGPQSLAAVTALARTGADVVAVAVEVGQRRELDGVRDRARAAGAARCHVLDREETFAADVLWPAVRAGVDVTRPAFVFVASVLARALVELARLEQAPVVAHGARGANARVLTAGILALDPSLTVRAPLQDHDGDLGVNGEQPARVAVPSGGVESSALPPAAEEVHVDVSLLGRQVTGTALPGVWDEVPEDLWAMTRAPEACPDEPARLELSFLHGVPVAVNGVPMPLVELLDSVGTIASAHGVGRHDEMCLDDAGRVARVMVEAPALTALQYAYRALARLMTPAEGGTLDMATAREYTAVLENGQWDTPARAAATAAVDAVHAAVSGDVRLMLFKGGCHVVGRRSARYDRPGEHADAAIAHGA